MCDDNTLADNERYLKNRPFTLTRRGVAQGMLGSAVLGLLPRGVFADVLESSDVEVKTPDGTADAFFVHPAKGSHAAVLIWPDILSLRPAFRAMASRLAGHGYAVLVVNPYYRSVRAPVVSEGDTFANPSVREKVFPLARSLTPATNVTDANAFIDFLDAQSSVDTSRGVGTMGYCMGGPMTMRTAAARADRVLAGASFHGGRLVTDGSDSPHLLVPKMQASYLFAIAENDDEKEPEAKNVLRESFKAAGLSAEIEVYEGAMHGWCPPDSPVYHEAQAERAWQRLLALFETALA